MTIRHLRRIEPLENRLCLAVSLSNGQTMLKYLTITLAVIALVAQTAQAGHFGFGRGGLGLGGHHGKFNSDGFGRGGDSGHHGGLAFNAERLQTRFETKFEDLMSDYDTGLEEVAEFYSSEDYTDIIDGMESLVDRYDLFLSGVERSIDRLGDFISIATDDLTFYDELIAEYEAREDLSEERLDRILAQLTNLQEHLTTKIDFLTDKQTTLGDKLTTYQEFSADLSTYLSDIILAGGAIVDDSTDDTTDESAAALLSSSPLRSIAPLAATADDSSICDSTESALEASAVPETASQWLGIIALGLAVCCRPPRQIGARGC